MDANVWEWTATLSLAIALAATAGLRAWLPMLLAGGMARLGFLELGDSFAFLGSDRALIVFAVATVVEILADKIPAVDHVLDAISTVLRPAAGSMLAAAVIANIADPLIAGVLGIAVGGSTALVPHAMKSTLRTGATVITGGLANPVLSAAEDVGTVGLFVVAVLLPAVVVATLAVLAWFVWRRRQRAALAN